MVRLMLGALLLLNTALTWGQQDITPALDQNLVISSGTEGGGYWNAASRLQGVAKDKGVGMENLPSAGSLANLEALADPEGPVNLAFAQADALEYFLYDNPDARSKINVVEYLGQECVFIVTTADSDLNTDADLLKDKGKRLGIASHTSGVAVTFNNMTRRLPDLKNVEVVYGETAAAIDQLQDPAVPLDAVMVVHRPKEHSQAVDLVLRNPDSYRFLEISNRRLTQKSDDGQEVYRGMKLAIPGIDDRGPTVVNTICVKGLLLANPDKLNLTQQNVLTEIVSSHWGEVSATP